MRIILLLLLIITFSYTSYTQDDKLDCDFEITSKSIKFFKKAVKEIKKGNNLGGTKYYAEAIDLSPNYLQALWNQARLNKDRNNKNRKENIAIEAYKQIVEICPSYKHYYSYYYLGVLQYEHKIYGDAYKNLEEFLTADDDKIREKHYEDALDLSKYAKFYHKIYSNPVPFDPKLVSAVSSTEDEYLPSISPDNDFMYFTRRSKKSSTSRLRSISGSAFIEEFCIAKRVDTVSFEKGGKLLEPFNMQQNEGGATLTIDNSELFYTRCKIKKDKTLNCDICYSKYEFGEWSEVEILSNNVNTKEYWESMPSINSDGNTIYFVSDRPGGFGGYDIYRSTRDTAGIWSAAINMGPSINTVGNEKSPFIHTDSQTLYFSSSDRQDERTGQWFAGHLGLGGYDIFYTRLDTVNAWIEPVNIGYPINSKKNDLGFFVSTDGEDGFFASNKIGVKEKNVYEEAQAQAEPWNIYTFKLYKKARPQKVLFVKGTLRDKETNEAVKGVTIEIKNVKTKKIKRIKVDNETGNYAFTMVMKSDYTMVVKKKDYTYESKYISSKDTKFDVPANIDIEMQQVKIGKSYNLDDVKFSVNSAELNNRSKKVIDGFYAFLFDNPSMVVEIQGHTDNVGNDKFNMELSRDRAKSVYNYLADKGISVKQISSKGYGETKPIESNSTANGRAMNRRTVFVIIAK